MHTINDNYHCIILYLSPITSIVFISVATNTIPFVSAYPDVTTKDLGGPGAFVSFKKNSGFFIKYIIKTPPQTFGKYVFTVNKDDTTNKYFKVCRLLLIQIGDNYPCTETMPKSATGYETTILTHGIDASASKDKKRDGQAATYEFTVTDLYIVF